MIKGGFAVKIIKTAVKPMIKYIPPLLGSILMAVCLLAMPQRAIEGVKNGLSLCAVSVIPSLFPFMFLATFILKSDVCRILCRGGDRLSRLLFDLPGDALPAIIMGMLGGFPVGASMTDRLYREGRLTENQAQRMMLFCVNAGPAFVMGTVGVTMLSSHRAGILMFVSLSCACIIMAFFSRLISDGEYTDTAALRCEPMPVSRAFAESAADACASMLSVCAWVVLFSCVSGFAELLPLSADGKIFLKVILEVTNGCAAAAGKVPLPVMCLILGWCGLSVQCQVFGFASNTGIKYSLFVCARILSGAVAAAVCDVLLRVFPYDVSVLSNTANAVPVAYSASVPAAAGLLITGGLLILELDRSRKVC